MAVAPTLRAQEKESYTCLRVCACAQMVDIVPYTDNVEPIRAFLLPCVRCVGGKSTLTCTLLLCVVLDVSARVAVAGIHTCNR